MSKFCNYFEDLVMTAILNGSSFLSSTDRFLTLHSDDPGNSGSDFDITFNIIGSSVLDVTGWSFESTPTYDSINDRWRINNTSTISITSSANNADTLNWIVIRNGSGNAIVRIPLSSTYPINSGDQVDIYPGTLSIFAKNTDLFVATTILDAVWISSTIDLNLGTLELGLFSAITGISNTEITGTIGLTRITLNNSSFSVDSFDPIIYQYDETAFWGLPTASGQSNAFAVLYSGGIVGYQLSTYPFAVNVPTGILSSQFKLGVN